MRLVVLYLCIERTKKWIWSSSSSTGLQYMYTNTAHGVLLSWRFRDSEEVPVSCRKKNPNLSAGFLFLMFVLFTLFPVFQQGPGSVIDCSSVWFSFQTVTREMKKLMFTGSMKRQALLFAVFVQLYPFPAYVNINSHVVFCSRHFSFQWKSAAV